MSTNIFAQGFPAVFRFKNNAFFGPKFDLGNNLISKTFMQIANLKK